VPTSRSSEGPGGRDAEAHATPPLHRALGAFDLVLLNVSAIVGLRYLSIAVQMGPSSLALWLLGLTTFLIPAALTVLELSSRLSGEGGMYLWSKAAFGELHAFIAGWSSFCSKTPTHSRCRSFVVAQHSTEASTATDGLGS
jgi:amino acid transporter